MRAKEFVFKPGHISEDMPLLVKTGQGSAGTQSTEQSMGQDSELDRTIDKMLKPGKQLDLPTKKGQTQKFKVTRVTANEVEIENPNDQKSPNQPEKLVYQKDDITNALKNEA
jgi:5-formyltetrahydrofolate cyclo-ligase